VSFSGCAMERRMAAFLASITSRNAWASIACRLCIGTIVLVRLYARTVLSRFRSARNSSLCCSSSIMVISFKTEIRSRPLTYRNVPYRKTFLLHLAVSLTMSMRRRHAPLVATYRSLRMSNLQPVVSIHRPFKEYGYGHPHPGEAPHFYLLPDCGWTVRRRAIG
jgi:hypothetical protein